MKMYKQIVKHEEKIKDTCKELGIIAPNLSNLDSNLPTVYLGATAGWRIVLAKALYDYSKEVQKNVNIVLTDVFTRWLISFNWNAFESCTVNSYDYSLFEEWYSDITWSASWFNEYSENKLLTGVILRMNWVKTPKEINFRSFRYNKKNIKKIKDFTVSLWIDKKIVVKPSSWLCWEWIYMLRVNDIDENYNLKHIEPWKVILVQEKIESYPVHINNIKKDWNLRVLVTFDREKQDYIMVWIIWRIDNDWGPINISTWADYISLEEISKLSWWESDIYREVKEKVEKIAIKSVKVLANRVKYKWEKLKDELNHQDLAWVDIIVDNNLEAIVLEVNSSNSWCIYELMKLEWVEALRPVAKSMLFKANSGKIINEITKNVTREIEENVSEPKNVEWSTVSLKKESNMLVIGYKEKTTN